MSERSIVVMMAHADDIELSAGGTLAKYIDRGYRALYGVLTQCNSGWTEDASEGGHYRPSEEIMPLRRCEAERASRCFGASFYFGTTLENCYTQRDGTRLAPAYRHHGHGDMPSGSPLFVAAGAGISEPSPELQDVIDLLVEWRPEVVICQAFQNWNPDHYAAALLLYMAWSQACLRTELGRFWIPVRHPSPETGPVFPPMTADHWEDVSGYEETVLEALSCHVSQGMDLPHRHEHVRRKWADWGALAGCRAAEAFVRLGPVAGP